MRFKSKLKLASTGLLALGGVAGLTAGIISCGSPNPDEAVYYSTLLNDKYTPSNNNKTLVTWLPWYEKAQYAQNAKKWILEGFGADPASGLISSGDLSGYTMDVRFVDSTPTASVTATTVVTNYFKNNNDSLLPDIVIGYPDLAAPFAQASLLHDLGDTARDVVAPGFAAGLNSVPIYTGEKPNYILPFSKSTDTSGFDIVVMAKILSDTAKAVAELTPSVKFFKVPANSDNDRMFRMITAPSTVTKAADGTVTALNLSMDGIYEDNPKADADKNVTYNWADFETAWTTKTKADGIWELDKPVVEKNFAYQDTIEAKTALASIKFNEPIFDSYEGISSFSTAVLAAYKLFKAADPTLSAFVFGQDSITNAIYSYQFNAAGHTPDGFFINNKSVKINGQDKTGVLRYELLDPATSGTFNDSVGWLSGEIKKGAARIKVNAASAIYSSALLKKHLLVWATGSTAGTFAYADNYTSKLDNGSIVVNFSGGTNVGEVYFGLQPTRAKASETKHSAIDQGPSMFVVDTHGKAVGAKVAAKLLEAFKTGAKVETVNNKTEDNGYWKGTSYMYGNKDSFITANGSPSPFVALVNNLVKDPKNWGNNIGRKVLIDYLDKIATDPDHYNLYTNPVDPHTYEVRAFFDDQYSPAFTNYFNGQQDALPTGNSLALALVKTKISDGWMKKAD